MLAFVRVPCTPCKLQACKFRDEYEKFTKAGVKVYGEVCGSAVLLAARPATKNIAGAAV